MFTGGAQPVRQVHLATPVGEAAGVSDEPGPLWPDRCLTDGRLVIAPAFLPARPVTRRRGRFIGWLKGPNWLARCGAWWLRLDTRRRWLWGVVIVAFTVYLGPLFLWLCVSVEKRRQREAAAAPDLADSPPPPEVTLAAWDTLEARVAGAASRAWAETLREPSWHSPHLSDARSAFDGASEVAQIVDLAVRVQQARYRLGPRPTSQVAEYWDRQQVALDDAARRLGGRADALIRHRDQAAALSAELQHLDDLERLERSAAEVNVLTVETAYGSGRGDGGLVHVATDIAAVRSAMTDLLDLMTRTRAPLAQPPEMPS
jgi:hypothetical protein